MNDATPPDQGPVDRRDLVFIAVDRTRTPMVICDPRQADNPIILANPAFLDLTGYSETDVIGRNCRFLQGPDTDRAAIQALGEAVREGRETEIEILNYRKDGSTFWNRINLSPVQDDTGALLYYFGSQVDVTQHHLSRASQAEDVRILLREIDHRAMNALAVVEGIVRLSRAQDIKQYAAAIQQRVQALARAHAFLAEGRWQAARVDDLLRLHIAPQDLHRATLDGPDLRVGATLVQPLALVLHEMVANARTHGCLSASTGGLALRWSPYNGGLGFQLAWEETGGPPPRPRRIQGFGSAMITAIIERQLRGQARLDWSQAGLCAEFTVPDMTGDPKPFQLTAGA
ncbi:PAS domain-containing protein [Caulobacter sp. UNC358MFTsu5.1]|uniref:PAS domain-containing protein n=1 Tax=Caulobacter sp. UNC358MFTsu5.1 TaxID=1449049 RepID=UPI0006908235|nr:PAS domain-containing protein [Caulobacter sp. UNC358MFTsu5.1]